MPRPPAAFSPLTMMKSRPSSLRNSGKCSITALRPGSPTMSPRKSMRRDSMKARGRPARLIPARGVLPAKPNPDECPHFALPDCLLRCGGRAHPLASAPPSALPAPRARSRSPTPTSAPSRTGSEINDYQSTISRSAFLRLMDGVFTDLPGVAAVFTVEDDQVLITTNPGETLRLRFAPEGLEECPATLLAQPGPTGACPRTSRWRA